MSAAAGAHPFAQDRAGDPESLLAGKQRVEISWACVLLMEVVMIVALRDRPEECDSVPGLSLSQCPINAFSPDQLPSFTC